MKCDGFGKLLKPLFSILLIGFFGLFVSSSVSAYNCNSNLIQCDGLEFGEIPNYQNGQFNGTVSDNKFNFSVVNSKYFLSKYNNSIVLYYWWERDGLHYSSQYFDSSHKENGKINGYYLCSQLPNLGYSYGLNEYNYCLYNSGFNSFSSNVKNVDRYSFNCGHSVSTSNCIVCVYKDGGDSYYCIDTSNRTVLGSSLLSSDTIEGLATPNPFIFGGDLVGSDNVNIDNTLTGDYSYTTCTYGELINHMESIGMSKYLCYGGLDNFDLYDSSINYDPVPGTGKTLGQILSNAMGTWDTPNEWFNFWNGLRGGYSSMWESYPAVYKTWFDLYYQYGGDLFIFDYVREYCIMKEMLDNDSSVVNNTYKGTYFTQFCSYIKRNPDYSNSGQVSLGVNWDGVGNMGSGETITNPKIAIQSFFDKLKANMTTDYFGLGAIPQYIIFFLMALILFRFLAH